MNPFGTFESTHAALADICRAAGRPRVLDLGCGTGEHLIALAPAIAEGLGIDVSHDAVATAARRARGLAHLAFRAMPTESLPQSDLGPFDVMLFVGSLEHMADPAAALAAARSLAHAGSRIVVVALSPHAPHALVSRLMLRRSAMPVVGHLDLDALGRHAAQAGLRVESARPLARGTRRRPATRRLLALYDRIGGPTRAVVLAPR